jgi:hypothetical protein
MSINFMSHELHILTNPLQLCFFITAASTLRLRSLPYQDDQKSSSVCDVFIYIFPSSLARRAIYYACH